MRSLLYSINIPVMLTPIPAAISIMLSNRIQGIGDPVADPTVIRPQHKTTPHCQHKPFTKKALTTRTRSRDWLVQDYFTSTFQTLRKFRDFVVDLPQHYLYFYVVIFKHPSSTGVTRFAWRTRLEWRVDDRRQLRLCDGHQRN